MTNIQYGGYLTSSQYVWKSHSQKFEGMVIGMGFTIGIPSISQWRGFAGGGSGIVYKGRSQEVWGTSVPVLSRANSR